MAGISACVTIGMETTSNPDRLWLTFYDLHKLSSNYDKRGELFFAAAFTFANPRLGCVRVLQSDWWETFPCHHRPETFSATTINLISHKFLCRARFALTSFRTRTARQRRNLEEIHWKEALIVLLFLRGELLVIFSPPPPPHPQSETRMSFFSVRFDVLQL